MPRPLIYLASPYSAPLHQLRVHRYEQAVCAATLILQAGRVLVFSPIAHTHPMAEESGGVLGLGWKDWAEFDRRMVGVCDELWILTIPGWQESVGVQAEVEIARELSKPVNLIRVGESEPYAHRGIAVSYGVMR